MPTSLAHPWASTAGLGHPWPSRHLGVLPGALGLLPGENAGAFFGVALNGRHIDIETIMYTENAGVFFGPDDRIADIDDDIRDLMFSVSDVMLRISDLAFDVDDVTLRSSDLALDVGDAVLRFRDVALDVGDVMPRPVCSRHVGIGIGAQWRRVGATAKSNRCDMEG